MLSSDQGNKAGRAVIIVANWICVTQEYTEAFEERLRVLNGPSGFHCFQDRDDLVFAEFALPH